MRRTLLLLLVAAFYCSVVSGVHAQQTTPTSAKPPEPAASTAPAPLPPRPHFEKALNRAALAEIAIQDQGRKKPLTVFCEETLLALSGKRKLVVEGVTYGPEEVVLGLALAPEAWAQTPLVTIGYRPLQEALGLPADQKLFAFDQLQGNEKLAALVDAGNKLREKSPQAALPALERNAQTLLERLMLLLTLLVGRSEALPLVPDVDLAHAGWTPVSGVEKLPGAIDTASVAPASQGKIREALFGWREAFQKADASAFAATSHALARELRDYSPRIYPAAWRLRLEYLYQAWHPFRIAWILYLAAAATLVFTAWGAKRNLGYRVAWTLAAAGLVLQAAGFAARVAIAGRPPVSNMYESIVWVAFGVVLFALILESIYRSRTFLAAACPIAIISLVIADSQPMALPSTLHPLVPVLRHNGWLVVHVLTITLSYAAFALALGVGHVVLWRQGISRKPAAGAALAALHDQVYRVLQIGVFLLATGTVLGGVWANYSWGRFWDWDPKETWALVALLCYLVVLHGRLVGWWAGFGTAVGAVLSFQAIIMAWYGVNFVLGVGLHSYGFGAGGVEYATAFVVAEVLFTAWAMVAYRSRRIGAD